MPPWRVAWSFWATTSAGSFAASIVPKRWFGQVTILSMRTVRLTPSEVGFFLPRAEPACWFWKKLVMLDVEARGSQSLLNVAAFTDPTAYKLKVKKPGSDEYEERNVDLLETFNWLIGLRVEHIGAPQSFTAAFKREPDPDLPADSNTKLIVDGRIKQDPDGPWWFRKVEGWTTDGNGGREKTLIVWRKLTGDIEQDNLMLDEWFKANCINTQDFEYDTIYVNGSNNLPNLKREQDNWKVRLIEEDFFRLMWDVEDV